MKSGGTLGFLRSWPGRLLLLCFIVASLMPALARAQAVTGTILGRITDGSGAVVPGVAVTMTNTGTKLTRVVTTDSNGEYTAPSLPTGEYSVAAEISGFKTVTMSNIDLGVDQHARIDIKLEVGALSESVTIAAGSPLVQTSTSELARPCRTSRSKRCRSMGGTS